MVWIGAAAALLRLQSGFLSSAQRDGAAIGRRARIPPRLNAGVKEI